MLVFSEERLVAVLVQLSDQHEELGLTGRWYLETGYGRLAGAEHSDFPDLEAARAWISKRLGL